MARCIQTGRKRVPARAQANGLNRSLTEETRRMNGGIKVANSHLSEGNCTAEAKHIPEQRQKSAHEVGYLSSHFWKAAIMGIEVLRGIIS